MKNTPTDDELKTGVTYTVYLGGDKTSPPVKSTILVKTKEGSGTETGTVYTVGDVDGNGSITIGDVTTLIDKVLNKIEYFKDENSKVIPLPVGDVDNNNSITIGDVTTAIDKVLNKIDNFEKPTYTLPSGTTAESTYNVVSE